jgi:hypothetical protein
VKQPDLAASGIFQKHFADRPLRWTGGARKRQTHFPNSCGRGQSPIERESPNTIISLRTVGYNGHRLPGIGSRRSLFAAIDSRSITRRRHPPRKGANHRPEARQSPVEKFVDYFLTASTPYRHDIHASPRGLRVGRSGVDHYPRCRCPPRSRGGRCLDRHRFPGAKKARGSTALPALRQAACVMRVGRG